MRLRACFWKTWIQIIRESQLIVTKAMAKMPFHHTHLNKNELERECALQPLMDSIS